MRELIYFTVYIRRTLGIIHVWEAHPWNTQETSYTRVDFLHISGMGLRRIFWVCCSRSAHVSSILLPADCNHRRIQTSIELIIIALTRGRSAYHHSKMKQIFMLPYTDDTISFFSNSYLSAVFCFLRILYSRLVGSFDSLSVNNPIGRNKKGKHIDIRHAPRCISDAKGGLTTQSLAPRCFGEALLRLLRVHDMPNRFEVLKAIGYMETQNSVDQDTHVGLGILVLEVKGMLPNVDTNDGRVC